MRIETREYKIFKFEELSESAQDKALQSLWDVNVMDGFWFEHIAEEIKEYGGELVEFDTDRSSSIIIKINSPELFAKSILENHGEKCDTHMTAYNFLNATSVLYSIDTDDLTYEQEQELEDLESDFTKEISGDYLTLLRESYKYATSEEAIKETIEINEYEFTEDGELY